jgi:UDP-2,4-diacetamido-2,4,6-trideoxy-beta-L-altropyranose hydrolase
MNKKLRPATLDDCKLLFDWANDPDVRKASFSSKPIEWNEHVEWLSNKLKSQKSYIYIFKVNDIPIGMIRFDKEVENTFVLSYSISSEYRGKSYSSKLITEGLNNLFEQVGHQISVIAFVKIDNVASQKTFLKNNFSEDSATTERIKYIKTIIKSN